MFRGVCVCDGGALCACGAVGCRGCRGYWWCLGVLDIFGACVGDQYVAGLGRVG